MLNLDDSKKFVRGKEVITSMDDTDDDMTEKSTSKVKMGLFSFKLNKDKDDLKDKPETIEIEKHGKSKSPKSSPRAVQPITTKGPNDKDKKLQDVRISLRKEKPEGKLNSGITIDDNSSAIRSTKNLPQQTLLIKSKTKVEEVIQGDKRPDDDMAKGKERVK